MVVGRGEGVEKGIEGETKRKSTKVCRSTFSGQHGAELRAPTGSGSCQSQCNPIRISPGFIMESWQPPFPQSPGGTLSSRLGTEGRWGL